jgi:hypothetical protein
MSNPIPAIFLNISSGAGLQSSSIKYLFFEKEDTTGGGGES